LEEEQTSVLDLTPRSSHHRRGYVEEQESELPDNRTNRPSEASKQQHIFHQFEEEDMEEPENQASDFENNLIPSTEFLKDIEVNYKEVIYEEEDFVFIETPQEDTQMNEVEEEESETMLVFDFPL